MLKLKSDGLSRFGLLVAIAALVYPGPQATEGRSPSDSRQQVWTTRIAQLVKEPPAWAAIEHHETEALAFSPDNKRLAVTITHHQRVSERNVLFNTHLIVIDVQSPETNVHQFDLTGTCGVDMAWNESGDALLVCGTLLRFADGTSCVVSPSPVPSVARYYSVNKAFWLDSEHVVRWTGEILDLACKQIGNWQLERPWRIGAVATSKGWVFLSHAEGPRLNVVCEYSIVDRASHRALSGWPTRKLPCGGNMMLAVGAEALCFNITGGKLHCWSINGGTEISVSKQVGDYVLNQAATSSARVVADKWENKRFAWESPALPRRRVIFDLRSGVRISSWKPRMQHSTSPSVVDWPYHCVLSAHGEFVAESGDGSLDLYRVAP